MLKWQDGMFLPLPGVRSLDKVAQEAKAEEVFMDLLRRFTRENRNTSHKTGHGFAPALFAAEEEARRARVGKADLAAAMRRLFQGGKITNAPYGKPSRQHYRLVVAG